MKYFAMAEAGKTSTGSNNLGVTFKNQNAQSAKAEDAVMSELYGRSLSAISKPGQPQVQTSFNVENAFSGKSGEAGTFVSDRKKDRPSFFENVAEAFSEWRTMTVRSLIDHNILAEKKPSEKTGRGETVHAILTESAIQDVPTISALKQETIEKKPHAEIPHAQPVIKKSTTMLDASKEALVPTAPNTSRSAAVSTQKIKTYELQKVRTFKSDAARLQPDVAPESPEVPAALMHEPEAPAPEPKLNVEEVHVVPIDMRASMIAPEVSMHIDTEVVSTPTKKSDVLKPEKIEAPAPDIARAPQTLRAENIPAPVPETPSQWTHVLDVDTPVDEIPLSEIKSLPPLPQREIPPVFSGNTPVAFEELRAFDAPVPAPQEPALSVPHKDRLVRIEEKIRSMQPPSETSPDPVPHSATRDSSTLPYVDRPLSELGDTVKPDAEPVLVAAPIVPAVTPQVSVPEDEPVFHTRTAPVRTPLVQNNEVVTPAPLRTAVTPAPVRVPETGVFARFAVRIVLILCVTGTVMVSGAYLFTRVKPEPGTTPVRTDPAPVIPDEDLVQFILTVNSPTLLTDVQQIITAAPAGLTELTVYTGEPARAATTQEFFAALNTNVLPRTVRALEPVFIVGGITTTKNEPFVLIRSNNFDSLFAGLLAWEPSMQQDLAPLFGTPDAETASFTDAVRDNKSIRILRDASGNEVMLYSFIDNRTVVITSSGEALSKLIEQF